MDKANNPTEIIDLVDKDDQIIGEVERGRTHLDPSLIHREIAVIITDKDNRILFQQRSSKKKDSPLVWSMACAGHIPKGIDPLETAHNELKEELGFDLELVFYKKVFLERTNATIFYYLYSGKYGDQEIDIEREEVEQVKFVSKEEFEGFFTKNQIGKLTRQLAEEYWDNI